MLAVGNVLQVQRVGPVNLDDLDGDVRAENWYGWQAVDRLQIGGGERSAFEQVVGVERIDAREQILGGCLVGGLLCGVEAKRLGAAEKEAGKVRLGDGRRQLDGDGLADQTREGDACEVGNVGEGLVEVFHFD